MKGLGAGVFLVASIALRAQALPQAAGEDLAKLEGVVRNQVTGEPVRKVNVSVSSPSIEASAMATTDASGAFTIRNLPPGQYWISAEHPAFVSPRASGFSVKRTRVTLKPGETKKNVALAVVPGAALSGKVLYDNGDPLDNCPVELMRVQEQRGQRRVINVNSTSTNLKGEFRFGPLAPGKYYALAQFLGEPSLPHPLEPMRQQSPASGDAFLPQFYPGSYDLAGAAPITLNAGTEVRGIDFRMRLSHLTSVHVRVVGPDEAFKGPLQVFLRPSNLLASNDKSGNRTGIRMPNQEYDIPYVAPGSYSVYAFTFASPSQYIARQRVDVGTDPPPAVTLTLSGAADIAGSLDLEGMANASLHDCRLRLESLNEYPAGIAASAALEGPEFTLSNVMPGRWRLIVEKPGDTAYLKSIRYGDEEIHDRIIDVQPGAPARLRMTMSGKGGAIEGAVQPEHELIDGLHVVLVPEGERSSDSSLYRVSLMNGPNTAGAPGGALSYRFTNLPPGKYRLFAVEGADTGLLDDTERQKKLESRSESVTLAEGERAHVALKAIAAEDSFP